MTPNSEKGLAKGLAQGSATGLAEGPAKGLAKVLAKGIAKGLATGPAVGLKGPEIGTQGVKHTRAKAHASTSRRKRACTQAVCAEPQLARKRGFGAIRLRVPLCARPQIFGL